MSRALKRCSQETVHAHLKAILQMNNNCASSGTTAFFEELKEAVTSEPWCTEARALFRKVCPAAWKSAAGEWEVAGMPMTGEQRSVFTPSVIHV